MPLCCSDLKTDVVRKYLTHLAANDLNLAEVYFEQFQSAVTSGLDNRHLLPEFLKRAFVAFCEAKMRVETLLEEDRVEFTQQMLRLQKKLEDAYRDEL